MSEGAKPGAPAVLRRTLATLADGLATRAELGATEVQEEALRTVHLAVAASCTALLLGQGFLALLLALVWWAGPERGAGVMAVGALVLLGAGTTAAWWWRELARAQRPLLADTLRELRADARALGAAGGGS